MNRFIGFWTCIVSLLLAMTGLHWVALALALVVAFRYGAIIPVYILSTCVSFLYGHSPEHFFALLFAVTLCMCIIGFSRTYFRFAEL
ncbi:MAG: hypothetical protein RI911_634 [Candidatus Parcubacteria bacterium]|jgi:hypothetical protein